MSKPLCEKYDDVLAHVDASRPVEVYRNLHKNCLSVRQDGIVRCHADAGVVLFDVTFVVREKGRQRVLTEKKKNVHAFLKGYVRSPREANRLLPFPWVGVYYNPYTCEYFKDVEANRYASGAQWVDIAGHYDGMVPQILAFNLGYVNA